MKYIGITSPQWSIPKQQKFIPENIDTHNQGYVTLKSFTTEGPKFSFPQDTGDIQESFQDPQEIDNKTKKIEYKQTFPKSERKQIEQNSDMTPGPGNYKVNYEKLFRQGPRFSLSYKHRYLHDDLNEYSLGPCHYDPKVLFWKKGTKFGKQKKDIEIQKEQKTVKDFGSKIAKKKLVETFGKTTRSQLEKLNTNPGPGFYNTTRENKIQNVFKLNMISKKKKQEEVSPGPGRYLINNGFFTKKNKGIKFGKTNRFVTNIKNFTDGVEVEKLKVKTKGFTIGKSKIKEKNDLVLGPGDYDCSQKENIRGYSFNKSEKVDYQNKNNPQSIINPNKILLTNPKYSFQKQEKFQKQNESLPGYVNTRRQLKNGKFSFFKQNRFEKIPDDLDVTPGPCCYTLKSTIPHIQPWLEQKNSRKKDLII